MSMDSAFLPFAFEGERARWANGLCGFAVEFWRVSRGAFGENGGWLQAGRKGSGGAFQRGGDVL